MRASFRRNHRLTPHGSTPSRVHTSLLSSVLDSPLPDPWQGKVDMYTPDMLTQVCTPTNNPHMNIHSQMDIPHPYVHSRKHVHLLTPMHVHIHKCGNTYIMYTLTQMFTSTHAHVCTHECTFTFMDLSTPMQ